MQDVVVTGLGIVSPIGNGVEPFWEGLLSGRSGAAPITSFDASEFPVRFACEVKDFEPRVYMEPREALLCDRFAQMGFAAVTQAWQGAGLDELPVEPHRAGIIIGTGMGATETFEREHKTLLERGPGRVSPVAVTKVMLNAPVSLAAIRYGITGLTWAISSACATGGHAIGEAAIAIQSGRIDLAIAGATESAMSPLWLSVMAKIGALSRRNDEPQRASRPFDAERDGFVGGEGAGAFVLERRDLAEKRGARILAEVVGFGTTNDAFHLVQPDADGTGAAQAMTDALQDARINPQDVDYINAHGTSTPLNDRIETIAIKSVMGPEAKRIPISATKSQIGHLSAAAGAVEAAVAVLAIDRNIIPGTINLDNPDPECDLDYVPDGPRETGVDIAITNSFGLGGHNSCLVFKGVSSSKR